MLVLLHVARQFPVPRCYAVVCVNVARRVSLSRLSTVAVINSARKALLEGAQRRVSVATPRPDQQPNQASNAHHLMMVSAPSSS